MTDITDIIARVRDMVDGVKPNPEWPSDARALLDEIERLKADRDDSEERCGRYAEENQKLYDKWRAGEDKLVALSSTYEAAEAELAKKRQTISRLQAEAINETNRANKAEAELARLRAPVEGEAGEMVKHLRDLDIRGCGIHCSIEGTLGTSEAADLITRQAARLREAREFVAKLADDPYLKNVAYISTPVDIRLRQMGAWLDKEKTDAE